MWGKLSVTQKVIFIGIIVLVVVDLILWGNVSRLKNPYSRFEDAINEGDLKTAISCYQQMQGSNQRKNRFNAEKLAVKFARISTEEYLNGYKTYEEAEPEVREIQEKVVKNDRQVEGYLEKIEFWHASEEALRLGREAKDVEEYEKAIEYFEQVNEKYTGYSEAQELIAECKELHDIRTKKVLDQAAMEVHVDLDVHTYLNAIKILDDYIEKYPNDNFVAAKREQFVNEYYNIQLLNIKMLIDADEKEMALDIARSLEELDPGRKEAKDYIRKLKE